MVVAGRAARPNRVKTTAQHPAVTAATLAGDAIVAKLTRAPGNDAPIGGLKVASERGWFAARPSGTENVYKIYAESMVSPDHLDAILVEARAIVARALVA